MELNVCHLCVCLFMGDSGNGVVEKKTNGRGLLIINFVLTEVE